MTRVGQSPTNIYSPSHEFSNITVYYSSILLKTSRCTLYILQWHFGVVDELETLRLLGYSSFSPSTLTELLTCDVPNPWEFRTTAIRLHTDRYWSYKCQCCRETLGVWFDSSSSRIGPEGSSPQRLNSMQDMSICPHHGFTLPAELIHNIISWVLVNSIHSICVSTEDVNWEKDVMNILCDVSPSFRAIAIEIVAKAFEISRGTDEEEERWTPTLYYLI